MEGPVMVKCARERKLKNLQVKTETPREVGRRERQRGYGEPAPTER
jgi:hypothetical protein